MINAVPNGEIMSWTVFEKTVKFIQETRIPFIMLSGGEPIDHPLFLGIVNYAKKHGLHTIILSNGMFLEDKELREKVLDLGCVIQITNDKRYYPKTVPIIKHELLCYEDTLRQLSPFGRALKKCCSYNW
jgi:MoaA/NifB/PqqE/SkfB family radical SAM enzyme